MHTRPPSNFPNVPSYAIKLYHSYHHQCIIGTLMTPNDGVIVLFKHNILGTMIGDKLSPTRKEGTLHHISKLDNIWHSKSNIFQQSTNVYLWRINIASVTLSLFSCRITTVFLFPTPSPSVKWLINCAKTFSDASLLMKLCWRFNTENSIWRTRVVKNHTGVHDAPKSIQHLVALEYGNIFWAYANKFESNYGFLLGNRSKIILWENAWLEHTL